MLSVPPDEVAYIELRQNRKSVRRLNMALGFLAFAFILLGLAFIGYYSYTKYVQVQLTPEQQEIAKATKAIRANPRNSSARVRLGVLYMQAGQPDDAIEQFDEALKIARDDQEALLYAGIAYMNKQQYEKALTYFNKLIKYYKTTALAGSNMSLEQSYYYGAVAYWKMKDYDKAIDYVIKALQIKTSNSDSHLLAGRIYMDKKQYDEAVISFQQALKLDPSYPDALYGLGLAYEAKGDKTKALENYKAALKAKADFQLAKDAVARLEKKAN